MKLSDLKNNDKAIIVKVLGRGAFRKRITEMGFVKGKEVVVVKNAPLKDPIEYKIMGYEISLRRSEAELIEVVVDENYKGKFDNYSGVFHTEEKNISLKEKHNEINIALVGNPNCGKTTLFNYSSNSKEHVGNYVGVTVDSKSASFNHNNYKINLTDLPGTYSISAYSPEELFVREFIVEHTPDIVINVIDSSNIERNLYLTTQLIDMDIKVIIALNMYDELLEKGDKFDYMSLGKMLGIPIIPTISSKKKGLDELYNKAIEVFEENEEIVRHIHINYGTLVEKSISSIQEKLKLKENLHLFDRLSSRFLAIKLIEKDKNANEIVDSLYNSDEILNTTKIEIKKLENEYSDDSETIITDAKYAFIAGALKETYKENNIQNRKKTELIDAFLTHKLFGFPIFIFFMWLMFQSTFTLGSYPMDWIDGLIGFISDKLDLYMPEGSLKDLLINGIIGGVGGVIIFLPNIVLLFLFISIMEDTGYMSRAAFIMDKLMHKIGLHGKSFIPLIMGFGCNVPAIMATRTIENKNDRILTILINPFMSCSARLPVYVLLISAFFPENSGTVLFSLYIIGIIIAILFSLLFKRLFFKKDEAPFVMELPPYRVPTAKSTIIHMWNKAYQYLQKMGGIILIASVLIWALGYFPTNVEYSRDYNAEVIKLENQFENTNNPDEIGKINEAKNKIYIDMQAEKHEKSYIGKLGHFFEPVILPLGFDWKMGVSLLTGFAAKEVVVSTMGVLYHNENLENDNKGLVEKLKAQKNTKGEFIFNKLVAFSFMIFILLYVPCVATVAAIKKETGSWKWAAFSVFYTTLTAWIMAFLVYNIGSLFF